MNMSKYIVAPKKRRYMNISGLIREVVAQLESIKFVNVSTSIEIHNVLVEGQKKNIETN